MEKKRIAFVVIRYGEEINGGVEYHCRMLAERLADDYIVEVLTTCVCNTTTGENELPEGGDFSNGVLVRRFKAAPVERNHHEQYLKAEKSARKLRRLLYRWKLLRYIANIHPIWSYKYEDELKAFQSYPFYSTDMNCYIKDHKDNYAAFIPLNLAEPTTYFSSMEVPEKTILIPTLHNQNVFFKALQTRIMTNVSYIGFNTEAEQKLAERIFGKKMSSHGIISVGVESVQAASWEMVQEKYRLPEKYLLYMGRITASKTGDVFRYFKSYKERFSESSLQLVLMGGGGTLEQKCNYPDAIYTGFVSEEEKMAILQHACVVVNPSKYESLSLMLLEAMSQGIPVLVNGLCDVLKEHCIKSNGAALYYTDERGFVLNLHKLETSETIRREIGQKAIKYVRQNYDWTVILDRLKKAIENVAKINRNKKDK